jgi:hypothetical protein
MLDWLVPKAQAVDIKDVFGPATTFPTVGALINVIVKNILTIAGILALVAIVFSGLQIIIRAGNMEGEKAAQSKGAFTAAIVGIILIFGAYFILQIVETILGYPILNPNF